MKLEIPWGLFYFWVGTLWGGSLATAITLLSCGIRQGALVFMGFVIYTVILIFTHISKLD